MSKQQALKRRHSGYDLTYSQIRTLLSAPNSVQFWLSLRFIEPDGIEIVVQTFLFHKPSMGPFFHQRAFV